MPIGVFPAALGASWRARLFRSAPKAHLRRRYPQHGALTLDYGILRQTLVDQAKAACAELHSRFR